MEWRLATLEDSRILAELNLQLIADQGHDNPMDAGQLEQRMRDWLASEYRAVLFQRRAEIVAYALFRDAEHERVHLRQFFVVRQHRRQGVGRAAMHAFRDEVLPRGKRIVLEVLIANAAGRAFWLANGFREYALTLESPPAREQRFVFDEVAQLYARVRPTYPAALVDDLIRAAALRPSARILELGAGPGNASVLFAGRGYRLLCLEPGPQLAQVAAERLAADENARVAVTTFEDWKVEPAAFDLVFAAQAFHWIDPTIRFAKAARALRPDGMLAVFANRPLEGTSPLAAQIQSAYAAHAPALAARVNANHQSSFLELFATTPEFSAAQAREYGWSEVYDAARYVDLLRTQSDHRLLAPEPLERLFAAITAAIEAAGGKLRVDYVSVLCWARRAAHSTQA